MGYNFFLLFFLIEIGWNSNAYLGNTKTMSKKSCQNKYNFQKNKNKKSNG